MNPVLSLVLVLATAVTAIAIVLTTGLPLIDTGFSTETIRQAGDTLTYIDNYIQDVADEGAGAKRVFDFSSPGEFTVIPQEDAVQFGTETNIELFEHMSRNVVGNLVRISGNDVSCSEGSNITMENSYLKVVFQKVNETSPLSSIDTSANILMMNEKTSVAP